MNCPNCNCEVPSGLLFCNECGVKIENVSLCKECGTTLRDGVLFCPVCRTASRDNYNNAGAKDNESMAEGKGDSSKSGKASGYTSSLSSDDSIERTMTIPVIKPNIHRPSESGEGALAERPGTKAKGVSKNGLNQKNTNKQNKYKGPSKKTKNGLSLLQKNILIFIVVFISVVFTGIMCMVALMKTTYNTPALKKTKPIVNKTVASVESEKDKSKPDEETLHTEDGHSKHIDVYDPHGDLDLDYEFQLGISPKDVVCANKVSNLKNHENPEFYFSCSVPESFVVEENGSVEVRYLAEDKTAYLDIGAFKNDKKWSRDAVRDAIIGSLGGAVDYQSSGDGWFTVNIIKNGIYYYQKCMVNDESIRYFEFAYPEEYSDVYSEYVSNIDSGFREIK